MFFKYSLLFLFISQTIYAMELDPNKSLHSTALKFHREIYAESLAEQKNIKQSFEAQLKNQEEMHTKEIAALCTLFETKSCEEQEKFKKFLVGKEADFCKELESVRSHFKLESAHQQEQLEQVHTKLNQSQESVLMSYQDTLSHNRRAQKRLKSLRIEKDQEAKKEQETEKQLRYRLIQEIKHEINQSLNENERRELNDASFYAIMNNVFNFSFDYKKQIESHPLGQEYAFGTNEEGRQLWHRWVMPFSQIIQHLGSFGYSSLRLIQMKLSSTPAPHLIPENQNISPEAQQQLLQFKKEISELIAKKLAHQRINKLTEDTRNHLIELVVANVTTSYWPKISPYINIHTLIPVATGATQVLCNETRKWFLRNKPAILTDNISTVSPAPSAPVIQKNAEDPVPECVNYCPIDYLTPPDYTWIQELDTFSNITSSYPI